MPLTKYWETNEFTTYADIDSSKRIGNKVNFWIINDYHVNKVNAIGQAYRSDRVLFEIDCMQKTRRVLEIYLYNSPMANGEIIYSNTQVNDQGGSVPDPGKVGHKTWEIACSIK